MHVTSAEALELPLITTDLRLASAGGREAWIEDHAGPLPE
jgi:predicted nucleic acid-binding protein